MAKQVSFRPHGRLLTMLGEQLIKSDKIALVELIKNSYDADATLVTVDFRNFTDTFEATPDSSIVITDNGIGMSEQVLDSAWMSPATPEKLRRKSVKATTELGRTLQGEKGIGRFAVFKLGSRLSMTTRASGSDDESTLTLDISSAEEPASPRDGSDPPDEVYLDELRAIVESRQPRLFASDAPGYSGTQIEIGAIRSSWNRSKVEAAYEDLDRMQPIMWSPQAELTTGTGFVVTFLRDGVDMKLQEQRGDEFQATLERAVLKVTNGRVDVEDRVIDFDINGRRAELQLDSAEIRGMRPFKNRFVDDKKAGSLPEFHCGSFSFEFYIFDFSGFAPAEHLLDKQDKERLRQHRIYLYRDDVRVYPYGDPDDDWLQIDVIRGTQSARSMFSNDQALGFVSITQAGNPDLRDKTNREGLLETGAATGDFVALIQTVLAYLRDKPYEQYASANRRARQHNKPPREIADEQLKTLRARDLPEAVVRTLARLESAIETEREVAQMQLARTQDLAGVGLSVESASHDLIAAAAEALRIERIIVAELRQLGLAKEYVFTLSTGQVQRLEFIDSRFQDVQGLFVSTRQKRGIVDVLQQARKVRSMYAALHDAKGIKFELDESVALKATTTEAAVLQALINLVDNATYWLMHSTQETKLIRLFTTSGGSFIVTDDGPGVAASDRPFIFEAFYSGKGDAGKGLGLFIASEVAARNGFSVELSTIADDRVLPGATFILTFLDHEGEK